MGSTDTVATRVATTYHEHILALSIHKLVFLKLHACQHSVLLRQHLQSQVYALEIASRNLEVACLWCTCSNDVGIVSFRQLSEVYMLIIQECDALFLQ